MLSDKGHLLSILDRIEIGLINSGDIAILRGVIERLDEMDDLVDTVCSCRTQEIPILRGMIQKKWDGGYCGYGCTQPHRCRFPDDDAPGRP